MISVLPGRGYLSYSKSFKEGFECYFHAYFEPAVAFDYCLFNNASTIHLKIIGNIVCWYTDEVIQRNAG